MVDKLLSFFKRHFPLTKEESALIKPLFTPKSVKQGELLLREGDIARHGMFVALGCLRTYTLDDKGKEHILQFSPEDWWTGDMNSIINGVPSQFYIDALEETDLLLFDQVSLQQLTALIPASAPLYQAALQNSLVAKNQRIVFSLSASAQERYTAFVKTYPTLLQRVPQHMIAAYLGMTPETLSRIRKQLSRH